MKQRINRSMPSAAMLVAIIALVVAVGGGAYAATKLKKNAVKTKNIKAKAVTTDKLADKVLTAAKLGDVVVRTADSAPTGDDGTTNGGAVARTALVTASCQGTERLLTGGAKWSVNDEDNQYINQSYPEGNSWKAQGIVDIGAQGNSTLQVHAVCLK